MRRAADVAPTYRYVGAEARTLPGGWESLGDIGWFDDDGYLYLADRRTDMILVGGANVYPAEIEAAIDEHPLVQSSCVIGLPDEDLGKPHSCHRAGARRGFGRRPCGSPQTALSRTNAHARSNS